jgi:hypothetical protein
MIKLFEEEQIIIEQRRHFLILILELLPFIVAAISPIFILIFKNFFLNQIIENFISFNFHFIIFGLCFWWLLLWITAFIIFTNYYLDIFIVTNKRIIDIEQFSFFNRDIAEMPLASLVDIKSEVIGIINSLFDIGNLHIQSAGAEKEFIVKNIPHPDKILNLILQLYYENQNNNK